MSTWAIILAAGQGKRLQDAARGVKKQFLELEGRPLFWRSAVTLAGVPGLEGLVFVFPEGEFTDAQATVIDLDAAGGLGLPWLAVPGGERRQDSVNQALTALPAHCERVLVHDAARPFASAKLAGALLQALGQGAQAVVPTVPVKDTIKQVRRDEVQATLNREELAAVQTPQAFALEPLLQAHDRARAEGWDATDDAYLVERLGVAVRVVPGEEGNVKITTPEDLELLRPGSTAPAGLPCCGQGYDVHRFVAPGEAGRPLKLGGAPIPGGPEVLAHSDGDVLLHAVADALLGLLGQGDIGLRFPDSDPALDNIASAILVNEVMQDIRRAGIRLTHLDCTVVAQVPRLAPHRETIAKSLANLVGLPLHAVNVKATTEEGLGFTGEKRGLKAMALVSGLRPSDLPA